MGENQEKPDDTSYHIRGLIMDEITNKCKELNHLLRESSEYITYVQAKNAIMANESLYYSPMDFKHMYTDVLHYTEGNPYDEILRMCNENDELLHNSTVNEYLRAESAFSRLVKKVLRETSEGLLDQ